MENKQKTALSELINKYNDSIKYLESCFEEQSTEKGKIQIKSRLAQARHFLNYATKQLELERQQIVDAVNSQRQLGWDEKGEQYFNDNYGE